MSDAVKAYVVKAAVADARAKVFAFTAEKTMYGGKHIAAEDEVFVFASENEGGEGLIVRGVVISAERLPKQGGPAVRETPRVSITVRRRAGVKRRLGRTELKAFRNWADGRPESELCFKLYRQATNKVAGITPRAAAFLRRRF
jgi:hypothetical protein